MRQTWERIASLIMGGALAGALLLTLAACVAGGPGAVPYDGTSATSTATQTQGILDGVVEASPTCPVETVPQTCPPKPVPDRVVLIETTGGTVITKVTTDQQGRFVITLAPGSYKLQIAQGAAPYPIQRKPLSVTIVAGQTVQVQIELDSGIR